MAVRLRYLPRGAGAPMKHRDRYRVLCGVHAELEAAGAVLDIGQLDWACRQVEQRLFEASLDEQYERERARDKRQRANDQAAEWDAIKKRSRDAQRARG